MATGITREILKLMDESQDMSGPVAGGLDDRDLGIQFEGLRQIARHQFPSPCDDSVIGLGFSSQEPHEGRFAGTIATHESNAVARRQGQ